MVATSKENWFKIQNWFRKREFLTHISTMFAGNISAQLLALLTAPIITRLYSPSDFGAMSVVTSIISVVSIVACLRYERAIMLPKNDSEAIHILHLCLISTGLITFLAILLIATFKPFIDHHLSHSIGGLIWFVPVGVLLFGIREPFSLWFSRKKDFILVAKSRFLLSLWAALTKLVSAWIFGASAFWLVGGNMIGLLGGVFPMLNRHYGRKSYKIFEGYSRTDIIAVARKYKNFPIYSSWTGFIHSFSENIPVFFLLYLFSPVVVGYYGLAYNILCRPVGLISDSIAKVLFQKIAFSNAHDQPLGETFKKSTGGLAIIGVIPLTLLTYWGPELFSFVFGDNWQTAGRYAAVLSPWLFLSFIMPPAMQVITVYEQLRFNFWFHSATALARIGTLALGGYLYKDPVYVLLLFSLVNVVFYSFYVLFALHLVLSKDSSLGNT